MVTRAASGKPTTPPTKRRGVPAPKLATKPAPVPKKTAAKPTTATTTATASKPTVVTEVTAIVSGPELKKQELIEKVVERSDIKKKFAKPVVEAALAVLGEALAEGRELNLQPLGKVKYNRTKENTNARIIVAKIRQSKSSGPGVI